MIFCVHLELGHSRTAAMSTEGLFTMRADRVRELGLLSQFAEFKNFNFSPGNNFYNNQCISRISLHKHQ